MKPIPFGILTDSCDSASGLGRIGRDIASRLYKSNLPIKVATLGFAGQGTQSCSWLQYNLGPFHNPSDLVRLIPSWMDFTNGEPGILLTIYDLPRLEAFRFPELYGRPWTDFLKGNEIHLWGYFPVDSHTPGRGFTRQTAEVLRSFDRILGYGPYGESVLRTAFQKLDGPKAIEPEDITWLSHGIDLKVFSDKGKRGRAKLTREVSTEIISSEGHVATRRIQVEEGDRLLGVVATNQPRKDWGAVFDIFSRLGTNWKLWCHTDKIVNSWSLPDLAEQFGVSDRFFVTLSLDDSELADLYSACDVTLAPGLGEGFGYPIVESLGCGTPVVHLDFAGGADLLPRAMRIVPITTRVEGPYCFQRPVWDTLEAAIRIDMLSKAPREFSPLANPYDWNTLWPKWKTWLQEGISKVKTSQIRKDSPNTVKRRDIFQV